jgi:hypothetical protein
MPDAAVQDVNAEGAPQGRSAPGGMKIAGFPWWVWVLAAGGTFAVVWFLRNQSGSSPASTTAASTLGAAAGTDPLTGLPISTTDPMTADALLQAMQDLATRLGATHNSPAPAITPKGGVVTHVGAAIRSHHGGVSTTHTSGGSSTALTSVPGIPIHNTKAWITEHAKELAKLHPPVLPSKGISGRIFSSKATREVGSPGTTYIGPLGATNTSPSGPLIRGSFPDFTNALGNLVSAGMIKRQKVS